MSQDSHQHFVAYIMNTTPPCELVVFSDPEPNGPAPELVHRIDLTGDEDERDLSGILIDYGFVHGPMVNTMSGIVVRAIR